MLIGFPSSFRVVKVDAYATPVSGVGYPTGRFFCNMNVVDVLEIKAECCECGKVGTVDEVPLVVKSEKFWMGKKGRKRRERVFEHVCLECQQQDECTCPECQQQNKDK